MSDKNPQPDLLGDIQDNLTRQGYKLSPKAAEVFMQPFLFSKENDYDVYTDSYLYGLIRANSIAIAVFENLGVDPLALRREAQRSLTEGPESWSTYGGANAYDENEWLMEHVLKFASSSERKVIRSSDILCSLMSYCQSAARHGEEMFFTSIIEGQGLSLRRIRSELRRLRRLRFC